MFQYPSSFVPSFLVLPLCVSFNFLVSFVHLSLIEVFNITVKASLFYIHINQTFLWLVDSNLKHSTFTLILFDINLNLTLWTMELCMGVLSVMGNISSEFDR